MKFWEIPGKTSQPAPGQSDELRSVLITNMRAAAPVFDYAEFYQMVGSADNPLKPATAQGGSNRNINSNYTGVTTAPAFGAIALKILGDIIKTDIAYERRGLDIGSERLRQLENFGASLGRYMQDQLINGDASVDAKQINGLKKRVPVANVIHFDTANGGDLPLGNGNAERKQQQKFGATVHKYLLKAGPGAIAIGNDDLIARVSEISLDFVRTEPGVNVMGEPIERTRIKGAPLIPAGVKSDEVTEVITSTETTGTSANQCTSLYIVKFGEKKDVTLATNVGLQVFDEGKKDNAYQTMIDADWDLDVLRDMSIWRIDGIKLPA